MLAVRIVSVFATTAQHCWRLQRARGAASRLAIKQSWAKEVLSTLGYHLNIVGTPPGTEVYILVGNHVSYLDIPVLMAALPEATFIAKDDLRRWPIIGRSATAAETVFVHRGSGSTKVLARQTLLRILREKKQKIVVFPSGTTSLDENKPWKRGIFALAQETQSPVQLFRIDYSPLRESAYIDDDNLLAQLNKILKIPNKSVRLTWIEHSDEVSDPRAFGELLRQKVIAHKTKYL